MNFTRHRFMTSTAFSLILAMGIVSPGLANTIAIIGTGNVAHRSVAVAQIDRVVAVRSVWDRCR